MRPKRRNEMGPIERILAIAYPGWQFSWLRRRHLRNLDLLAGAAGLPVIFNERRMQAMSRQQRNSRTWKRTPPLGIKLDVQA